MQGVLLKNLKVLKADKGLTNKDLSDIMAVSVAVIKNYMRGKTPIPLVHLQALSSTTGVDIDWLLHGGTIQVNEPIEKYHSQSKVTETEQSLKDKFGGMASEVFEVIFEEIEALRNRISILEEEVNNINKS